MPGSIVIAGFRILSTSSQERLPLRDGARRRVRKSLNGLQQEFVVLLAVQ